MLKNTLVVLLVGLLFLVGAGYVYQSQSQDADLAAYPAPGRMVEAGGSQIHFVCKGQGSPWLMMESGLTSDSTDWELIWQDLAATTRVCAYDRPGLGWSENIETIRSASEVAAVLHELVVAENNPDPYVLLGMSAGGVYVRNYYSSYPENVAGMILIDSSHEQQGNRLPAEPEMPIDMKTVMSICNAVAPLGPIRAFDVWPSLFASYYDAEALGLDMETKVALANQSHRCSALLREMNSFSTDVNETEAPLKLGDLPLLVFSQGKPPTEGQEEKYFAYFEAQRKVWNLLQAELAALSSNSRRIIAKRSGHIIQFDQPKLLIDEINQFLSPLIESSVQGPEKDKT